MKKLYRSEKDRKIAGVCGGLGEYFDIDPVIPRIVFLVLLVGAGSGILLYLVFWFIMPTESEITSTHANNTKK
ncbi:MAG TPA: PspC domain-containing protein [Candidatus Saccharibacteria bacterium]|nr:PspC domain-containing protein [Candidatus Saccharibacteria bacterium]